VTNGPVPLMKEFLVVASRATRQVKDLGHKAHRYVFPDGRVAASALGLDAPQGLHSQGQ